MKDSQPLDVFMIFRTKYIKANNERFSTPHIVIVSDA